MRAPDPPPQQSLSGPQQDQDRQEQPGRDWIPVASWSSPIQDGLEDLRQIEEVMTLLKNGPPGNREHASCMQLLEIAQRTRRGEVAALILSEHSIELPDVPESS